MRERYLPRKLGLEEMVSVLVSEHGRMKEGLEEARDASAKKDFDSVGRILRELDPLFRQHIADEESTVLGLLVRRLGVKGAEKEILVFRQHRPIYNLMLRVAELAKASSEELEAIGGELEDLFREHAKAEESGVFPRAVSLGRQAGSAATSSKQR